MSMSGTSFAALVWTMLIISLVPGPSDIAVAARSAAFGFRQSAYMVAGIVAADILFILIAIYGLTAIVGIHPSFTLSARVIAGTILIVFGVKLLLSFQTETSPARSGFSASASSFVSGFGVTMADPKAIVFYMSLLPAFIDLTAVTILDVLIIITCATVVIASVKLNYAWLADRAANYFVKARKPLHIVAGTMLLAIGFSVLLQY